MAYPSSLDELTDGVPSDGTAAATSLGDATYQHDDHHRALAVAVEAVEAELGTTPSGASATVAARFGTLTNDVFTGAVSFGGGISLTGTSGVADRKITMQTTQVLYLPDATDFPGSIFVGNGGGSLAAGSAHNTGIGRDTLVGVTTGTHNTGLGRSVLYPTTTGGSNTGVGSSALADVTTGSSNVGLGFSAGGGITTGSGNTILGAGITGLAATSAGLTLVGSEAGASSAVSFVTAIGQLAGKSGSGVSHTVGGQAAGQEATGSYLALWGHVAGYQATGSRISGLGYGAAYAATGSDVVAVGSSALIGSTHSNVVGLGTSVVSTASNQMIVGVAGNAINTWVPGHDPDTYLDFATADTVKHYCGGVKVLELNETGSAPLMGFFGTAAQAKPTGVAVSAAGIHAALVTLGLIAA